MESALTAGNYCIHGRPKSGKPSVLEQFFGELGGALEMLEMNCASHKEFEVVALILT